MSATRASWLFVRQAAKLDEQQTQHVGQIQAGHPELERAYQLSQEFVLMLAERREADLDSWLTLLCTYCSVFSPVLRKMSRTTKW